MFVRFVKTTKALGIRRSGVQDATSFFVSSSEQTNINRSFLLNVQKQEPKQNQLMRINQILKSNGIRTFSTEKQSDQKNQSIPTSNDNNQNLNENKQQKEESPKNERVVLLSNFGMDIKEAVVGGFVTKPGYLVDRGEIVVTVKVGGVASLDVKSPVSGVLHRVFVQRGQTIKIGTPLFSVADEPEEQREKRLRKRSPFYLLLLKYILLYGTGAGILGWTLYSMWVAEDSYEWPATTANVVAGKKVAWSMGRMAIWGMKYEYVVDGKKYIGTRLRLGHPWIWLEPIPWTLKGHPERLLPGNTVNVYYNPKNPNQACLQTGVHYTSSVGWYVASLFFFLFGHRVT